jgi:hypothetical protein
MSEALLTTKSKAFLILLRKKSVKASSSIFAHHEMHVIAKVWWMRPKNGFIHSVVVRLEGTRVDMAENFEELGLASSRASMAIFAVEAHCAA